ncbi:MAG TPA: preprotein translocase subunit SecE [Candidatus Limnocylindrales bacterium]|nr:preprotein translocase subunit SecE [Candidatus Limnocylindrales bacterium]
MQRTPVPRTAAPRRSIVRNFEDIFSELRKVIWPSWSELRTMTFVVIVTVIVVSLLLGLIDFILSNTLVKFEFPTVK